LLREIVDLMKTSHDEDIQNPVVTGRESEDVCVPPWEYKHENGVGTVQSRSSTRDPDNVLNPPFRRPEVEDTETTHVVNTTETSESSSTPSRSTEVLLGDFNKVSSMPVTTERDNNVETDPALQGINEIGAATLRKQELKEKIVEQSTAIMKEPETMRGLYWQGMGQTPAPPPGDIVEVSINLHPTEYNQQWREWTISVAKDYLLQWSTSTTTGTWHAKCWSQPAKSSDRILDGMCASNESIGCATMGHIKCHQTPSCKWMI
jgi:hypothetical protein